MARTYDASRRQESALRTRERIAATAFMLHGQGILDVETLADEAGVSVATVRKHFPTREALFEGCTAHGLQAVPPPDVAALAAIEDPHERVREAVAQVCRLHEALLGQAWVGYQLENESPAMAGAVRAVEGLVANVGATTFPDPADDAIRRLANGLLSPLTYRGLRVHGQFTAEEAAEHTTSLLLRAFIAGQEQRGVETT